MAERRLTNNGFTDTDQFSASLAAQTLGTKAIHESQVWMAENIDRRLTVGSLAERVSMSAAEFGARVIAVFAAAWSAAF